MTTLANFVTNLGAITITGVSTKLTAPPVKLDTVSLPAMWVQYPTLDNTPIDFKQSLDWVTLTAQLVVIYGPVAQGTQINNWAQAIAEADNMNTTLSSLPRTFARGRVVWKVKPAILTVAGNDYWGVIADVTAHG